MRRLLLALAAAAMVLACSRQARLDRFAAFLPGSDSAAPKPADAGPLPPASESVTVSGQTPLVVLEEIEMAAKRIRNAELSLEVERFEEASRRAAEIAGSLGGYVADSQSSGEGERRRGTLMVRVPADAFDGALRALQSLGKVRSEHVSVQDITKAYADLETRLRVKRETAKRVREILRNRTAKLSDVLEAEKELASLVEQIETLEGERRWYDRQVALSTISAELHEPESVARPSAFEPLREALRDSVAILSKSLAAFLVGVLYVLPWGVLIGVLVSLLRRARLRARASRDSWLTLAPVGERAGAPGRAPGTGEKTKR